MGLESNIMGQVFVQFESNVHRIAFHTHYKYA